jgi:hypothetical protein
MWPKMTQPEVSRVDLPGGSWFGEIGDRDPWGSQNPQNGSGP